MPPRFNRVPKPIATGVGVIACVLFAGLALAAPTSRPTVAPASGTPAPASRPAHDPARETKAEVPELTAFHEVIFELWHTAWPDRNIGLMKELLPRVRRDFATVQAAELPGILRDKREAWERGLAEMGKALAAYDAAAAGSDAGPLLDAVEALHARFEDQMRIVRPHMRELGAYHVGLYQIYHRLKPGRELPGLRAMADTLELRCGELGEAKPPRWFEGDAAALKAECAALCARTRDLQAAARGTDWGVIDAAVEAMHGQYLKVEKLFE